MYCASRVIPRIAGRSRRTQFLPGVYQAFSCSAVAHAGPNSPPAPPAVRFREKGGDRRPMSERLSLKGKTTVVTGGARGIGLSLVEAAAEAGSDIAILDVLEEPQRDLSELGINAKYYRQVILLLFMKHRTDTQQNRCYEYGGTRAYFCSD